MANRTNKKKRDLPSPLQAFIIQEQAKTIEDLRAIIAQHEAARGIEAERLALASARANTAEERVKALEVAASIQFDVFAKGTAPTGVCSDDVITCGADPVVVKVPSQQEMDALNRGDFVDVSSPPGTGYRNYPENGGQEGGLG
jgi:hypothetical protein